MKISAEIFTLSLFQKSPQNNNDKVFALLLFPIVALPKMSSKCTFVEFD